MDILGAEEEVGSVVGSNRINSLVLDHTTTAFKKLLHVVKVALVEVLFLELVGNNERRTLIRVPHRQSKLGGSGPILECTEYFLERVDKFTLPTVGSTVAQDSSPFPVMFFCNKEPSKLLKHVSVRVTVSFRVWERSLIVLTLP